MLKDFLSASVIGLTMTFFASFPATNTYELNSYGFGSGGTSNSSTATYGLEGISGEISGQTSNTALYTTKPGFIETQQAYVPKVAVTNPSNYYDKLLFVLDQQNNPTDALYALQVKVNDPTCDFTTGLIDYVKSDHTLGASLAITDYQTYASWGNGSGTTVIGLASNTTYCFRAKATQGNKTESGYGPNSSAATVGQQLSFCLYASASCGGGNSVALGNLVPASITSTSGGSPHNIGVDFATNANAGGSVYIYSANGGLHSAHAGYTITIIPTTADLSAISEGFGAQVASVTQTSGGTFNKVSPYDGASNNVGKLITTANPILTSSNPLVGGNAFIQLQVKASSTTPGADDYSDILTVIAAALF